MTDVERTTEPGREGPGLVHEHGRDLRLTYDGRELARYVYAPWDPQLESPRPYLHPVRTLGGDLVSLYRPHDHVWHKGVAWSLPNVGTENFWGGTTYRRGQGYAQLPNDGSMRHRGFDRLDVDPSGVHVAERLDWVTQAGAAWFTERRTLDVAVHAGDDTWSLVFGTSFTNVSDGEVVIGSPTTEGRENAGYGGLFWRGPRSFSGGHVHVPDATGDDDLMGVRAPWMSFTGRHDDHGRSSTLVFVDDPVNPGHPTQWFVRSHVYACLCPAPFFSTEVPVAPGETLAYRYAVLVADGDPGRDGAGHLAATGRRRLAETSRDGAPTGVAEETHGPEEGSWLVSRG